ncbi:hypothetical protein K0H59_11725 [Shewanella sp. FJAT-51649]|uniref:hypothetical protein n=1 Tax=Shewanella sp. FJAT-51649 TaxID=2864210 RepID=UPI001C65758D|nr:hypothetical protein [Shewanella sp. FJAT-51649]QYJ69725.1 hypothetical protein K0H59_11725 [Shewanella sp. FJAT-51649]
MEELLKYFTTNVTGDKVWIAFLFLAVYYVLKKEPFKVFAHYSEKKEKEHDLAKTLLDSQKLGKEANEFLREHLERHAFRKYYGINADAEMREALIKFHRKHQRKIGWHDIRRAYSNITLSGTKISASLQWHEHLMRWIVTTLCYLVGAYALFVMVYAVLTISSGNTLTLLSLTLAALLLLVTAVIFSSLNWPYHSARKIISVSTE